MDPTLCIFDLDGTLVDSLQDIAESLNECLGLLGLPTYPTSSYRYMVGEGVPTLCSRALNGAHPELLDRLIELARARYRTRTLGHTRPYADVPELVSALAQRGVKLAVLSNKPHEMTVRIVEHYWGRDRFEAIQGYEVESARKPDPTLFLRICDRLGIAPSRAWMIGDTPTDVETARRAGAGFIGVSWGFRTRQDLEAAGATKIFEKPLEILSAIQM